jgi:hypothetical protein
MPQEHPPYPLRVTDDTGAEFVHSGLGDDGLCLRPLQAANAIGDVCALRSGHNDKHRSAESIEQQRLSARKLWKKNSRRYERNHAAAKAKLLAQGKELKWYTDHHRAMAVLKEPRPEGMTLSLVNPESPSAYWGLIRKDQPYRLSTDPNDYVWESAGDNIRRGYPTKQMEVAR